MAVVPKYRVLVVDDQRDSRLVLRASLETLGEEVKVIDVPSGEEAILITSRQPIDLLVTDVRLPGISGLELMERAKIRHPNMRVILVTGVMEPKLQRTVANAGAYAYFYKPITIADFLDAVQTCLGILEAAPPGTPSEEVEEGEKPAPSLSESLAGLRQELSAKAVILLDEDGEVIAQAGDLPDLADHVPLFSSLVAMFNSSLKVSHLLGVTKPKDLICLAGQTYDLFLTHVGQEMGLLSVTPSMSWDELPMRKLVRAMHATAAALSPILDKMGVPVEGEVGALVEPAVVEVKAPEQEVNIAEVLPDIERILQQAPQKGKPEDADAFWDALAQNESEEMTRAGAISYEQARKLGLAPEE